MSSSFKIDAHQHFWQIARGDYSWMTDEVAPIRKDILPPDLEPHLRAHGIAGTIVVQAADTVAETEFLLSLADRAPFIKGIVGWVDLENPQVTDTLDRLKKNPLFKGIRPMLQDIEDTLWIAQPQVLKSLERVAEKGLRLDALITPRHLEVLLEVAKALPDLPIVVDHCAKPEIAESAEPGTDWREGMARLAACPNVMCKISGLANEAGPDWDAERLQPTIVHVLEHFSPSRLMWGSDWPVLNLCGDYKGWREVAAVLLAGLSEAERAEIYGGTANRFYGLGMQA